MDDFDMRLISTKPIRTLNGKTIIRDRMFYLTVIIVHDGYPIIQIGYSEVAEAKELLRQKVTANGDSLHFYAIPCKISKNGNNNYIIIDYY